MHPHPHLRSPTARAAPCDHGARTAAARPLTLRRGDVMSSAVKQEPSGSHRATPSSRQQLSLPSRASSATPRASRSTAVSAHSQSRKMGGSGVVPTTRAFPPAPAYPADTQSNAAAQEPDYFQSAGAIPRNLAYAVAPERLRRSGMIGPAPNPLPHGLPHAVPQAVTEDGLMDHHRSDSGRSTGSSRSNTTSESLFLTNFHKTHRGGHDKNQSSAQSSAKFRGALGDLDPRATAALEAACLSQGILTRSESWTSTTPTSPEDEEAPRYLGADAFEAGRAKSTRHADVSLPSEEDFGSFWKSSDYSYGRGSRRSNEISLPPLMLSDAPIPPSRSQSLDPRAAPLEEYLSSSTRTNLDTIAQSPSVNTSPRNDAARMEKSTTATRSAKESASASTCVQADESWVSSLGDYTWGERLSASGHSREASMLRLEPNQLGLVIHGPTTGSAATLRHASIETRGSEGDQSFNSSSLSCPSAPASPKGRQTLIAVHAPTDGPPQPSNRSLRSAFSRSAKSIRNSLIWGAPSSQGLGANTVYNASSQSLSRSSVSSTTPSLLVNTGFLPVPDIRLPSPYSPAPSDLSLSALSSREDIGSPPVTPGLARLSDGSSQSHFPSTSSPTPRPTAGGGPKAMQNDDAVAFASQEAPRGTEATSLPPATSSPQMVKEATDEILSNDSRLRHARSRSRFSTHFSLSEPSWSRALTSMTGKKSSAVAAAAATAKPAKNVDAVKATKADNSSASNAKAGSLGMQRKKSHSAAQLEQMFADGPSATGFAPQQLAAAGSETPPAGLRREAALSLSVPFSAIAGQPPSPDPQISPSFAATFAFLQSALRRNSGDLYELPADDEGGSPTKSKAIIVEAHGDPRARLAGTAQDRPLGAKDAVPEVYDSLHVRASDTTATADSSYTSLENAAAADSEVQTSPVATRNALELPPTRMLIEVPAVPPQTKMHRKQRSLDSAMLFSRLIKVPAMDQEAKSGRDRGCVDPSLPQPRSSSLAAGITASNTMVSYFTTSYSGAFSPGDEGATFFHAFTTPLSEMPPPLESERSMYTPSAPPPRRRSGFEASPGYFPPLPAALPPPPTVQDLSDNSNRRRKSLSRTLSVVLDPLMVKSRPPSMKGPASPDHSHFDPIEPRIQARPETSMGFSFRKALRRERKSSAGSFAAAMRDSAWNKTTVSSSAPFKPSDKRPGSEATVHKPSLTGQERAPIAAKTAATSTGVRVPTEPSRAARGIGAASPKASSSSRLPGNGTLLTTPTKHRAVSDPVTPLSSRSRSLIKPLSPPSSYRAPLSRPLVTSSNHGAPSRVEAASQAQGRQPHAKSSSTRSISTSIPPVPTDYRNVGADQLALTAISGRSVRARSAKSVVASSEPRPASAKSLSTVRSATAEHSASAASSRVGEVRKPATVVRKTGNRSRIPVAHDVTLSMRTSRSKSKPNLPPIKPVSYQASAAVAAPPRSASSLDVRKGPMERRKMSQPTLDIADDREFLEALEQVRAVNRERIAAEAAEAEKKARLAKLGMMSANHLRTKMDQGDPSNMDSRGRVLVRQESNLSMASRRSASADARLVHDERPLRDERKSVDDIQRAIVLANADKRLTASSNATGLEWGVGKASGKLRDGAFVNDDDWKKEVKALFLIRELVQTERSYARHLASLLTVVKRLSTATAITAASAKRRSTGNLFATYSPSSSVKHASGAVPQHLAMLRTFLPQLIALSRGLIHRVEGNPTSAGVGAAFEILGVQLQATFVSWSSIVPALMDAIRAVESSKAKSASKLGLIPLLPPAQTEVGAGMGQPIHSPPTSPTRKSSLGGAMALDVGPSEVASGGELVPSSTTGYPPPPAPSTGRRGSQSSGVRAKSERRRTITSTIVIPVPPTLLVGGKRSGSSTRPSSPTAETAPRLPSRPSSPWSQLASFGMPRNGAGAAQAIDPMPSAPYATPTASKQPVGQALASESASRGMPMMTAKSLSPMDIVIMPTQRLPRYQLMLRDLLSNTPPQSLSHARVQRALDSVQRIASLCDAASSRTDASGGGSTISSSPSIAPR
ncbi:hypothetical protein ACQY0O_001859 [Thecaphora frezii]